MPMDFPDLESLRFAAKVHKFRDIEDGESEKHYRISLANHVAKIDPIESEEIRLGKGWDKFTDEENNAYILKKLMNIFG